MSWSLSFFQVIQRDLIRSLRRSREGPTEDVAQGNGKQPRTGLSEKRMLLGCVELCTRRFKIEGGQRLALRLSLPQGCQDGPAAAACVSRRMAFCMGEKIRAKPRIRLAWQRVAGLLFGCSRGDRL